MTTQANVITLDVAAALIKVSPRRVQQLTKEGWIKKNGERGDYQLVAVVQGYIDFLQDEARRSSKSAAQSRFTDARADEVEMRMIERSGALMRAARTDALAVVDEVIGGLRADLLAAPARITADLAMRAKIETVLNDALGAAAKRSGNSRSGQIEGVETADASGSDHSRRVGEGKPGLSRKRRRSGTA